MRILSNNTPHTPQPYIIIVQETKLTATTTKLDIPSHMSTRTVSRTSYIKHTIHLLKHHLTARHWTDITKSIQHITNIIKNSNHITLTT